MQVRKGHKCAMSAEMAVYMVGVDQERSVSGGPEQHSERGRRAQHLRSGRAGQHLHGDEAGRTGRQLTADQNQPLLCVHQTRPVQPPLRRHHEVNDRSIDKMT